MKHLFQLLYVSPICVFKNDTGRFLRKSNSHLRIEQPYLQSIVHFNVENLIQILKSEIFTYFYFYLVILFYSHANFLFIEISVLSVNTIDIDLFVKSIILVRVS